MKKIKTIILLIIVLGIQSCKHNVNQVSLVDNNFKYPLKIGNRWTYNVSTTWSDISPDSIRYMLTDTSTVLSVLVERDTVLDTNKVYKLTEGGSNYGAAGYYSNENNGFIKYGYNDYPGTVLPKSKFGLRFLFNGSYYNNIRELVKILEENVPLSKILRDTIYYFDPPRIIYKYPLEAGNEWLFSTSGIVIYKKVLGKEIINTGTGSVECYKIQWIYPNEEFGNIEYYEYVGDKGLLKTDITFHNIVITTIEYPDGVGTADVTYERLVSGTNF
jgi:hypothetical protein